MKYKIIFTNLLCLILVTSFVEGVENSIIPQIEKFEKIENLSVNRYSKNHFLEISALLGKKDECIRVVTYNILFNLYDHNLNYENRWPQRLSRVVELIEEMQPDVWGVQELYQSQFKDLFPHIEETYAFYAKPCSDGELNGFFYRKDRFKVLDSQVWYMSKTPDVQYSGTLTMLELEDIKTGKCFAVFNTHLSFSNVDKREYQARFIAKKIDLLAQKMPVMLMGDMNTFSNRLDLNKLPFYDGDRVQQIFTGKNLRDAKDVSQLGHLGPIGTFTNGTDDGIPFRGTGTPGVFLDHIYVSNKVEVLMHAVQPGTVNGHYPSDHLPVLIDCIIK